MKLATVPIIESPEDMSTDIISPTMYVGNIVNYSIQLVFSGSPVGSFKLQFSSDYAPYLAATRQLQTDKVLNWTDCNESEQGITEAGDHMWNIQNTGTMWVRVVYTADSGTASLDSAILTVKGV